MSEAERQASRGALEESRALYHQAAQEEVRAYDHVPAARSRTRGIIAVSAVALFYRAGAFDEANRYAQRFLHDDTLPTFAQAQLEELLIDSRCSQPAPAVGRADIE